MTSKQSLELIALADRERSLKLDLSGIKLGEVPSSVCKMTHLSYLDLSKNNLELLPDSIDRCHKLKKLDLNRNHTNLKK